MKELKIIYNHNPIQYKDKLSIQEIVHPPILKFNKTVGKLYTIVMVDHDAPSADDPYNKYWLHWLVINNNEDMVPYSPPNPPMGSGPHRYFVYIFEQPNELYIQPIK